MIGKMWSICAFGMAAALPNSHRRSALTPEVVWVCPVCANVPNCWGDPFSLDRIRLEPAGWSRLRCHSWLRGLPVRSDRLKDAPAEEIIRAVRAVANGGAYLDPATTGRVLSAYRAGGTPPPAAVQIGDLTAREVEVLHLIGRGATNEEIADQLVITEATVKAHITRIFDKLGLRDRAAAIVFAFDHGLVQPSA